MIQTSEIKEKFILVGVETGKDRMEESLTELEELLETAGGETVGRVIQNLESINKATYVGKGKVEEIRELAEELGADGIVCDDELSPAQLSNLKDELDIKVLDRTLVILDIFAAHAQTSEGKLQVELAQLKYRSSRLTGLGKNLSRLGGGIGTRGPGESKLESDRRAIRERVSQLRSEIEKVESSRETLRKHRMSDGIPVIAIVGYTNAGKSTFLNKITDAGILAEDKLFATLDPTTRSLKIPDGEEVLFTDTVGFISKLPHNLVDAFKSTLEEAKYADLILHVADASNPEVDEQMKVVYRTLEELKVTGKPVVTFLNKQDKLEEERIIKDIKADAVVKGSAKTGEGIDELLSKITEILREGKVLIDTVLSYADTSKISVIRKKGQLLAEEYEGDGIKVKAYVPKAVAGQLGLL
ncbi:GTPase HflX [Catonella massiliensis]|jgi:GTP-binding protein hflX|uniref:GTPase HflX n=1 Tax=Catonella massiliensis TaxID=2799636 RepID=A0ABS1J226_9FIRM|nr:GTPase HflX [Catonella massiliensis]MBK5898112.1 GTPase HflX [Catonella massiliensis]